MTIIAESDVHSANFVRGTRIYLDNQDVSSECFRAVQYEDGTGIAYCFVRNSTNCSFAIENGSLVTIARKGKVRIVLP